MAPLILLLLSIFPCACSSLDLFTYPKPLPERIYGRQSGQTIRVRVMVGFKRPGIYHVPQGTTLGELLEMARPLEHIERDGLPRGFCAIELKHTGGGKVRTDRVRGGPRSEQMHLPLREGSEIGIVNLVKWTL